MIDNVTDTFFVENPVAMAIAVTAFRIRDIHPEYGQERALAACCYPQRRADRQVTRRSPLGKDFSVHEILNRTSGDDSGTVSSLEPVFDYLNADGMWPLTPLPKIRMAWAFMSLS